MKASPEPELLAHDELDTPLGKLSLIADADARLRLVGWLEGHERAERQLRSLAGGAGYTLRRVDDPHGLSSALRAYFAGQLGALDALGVHASGTEFQRRVWAALREIPCGETWSYSQLAQRIGNAAAVRAVGLANGANPIGIVVPCHRVIGADGSLTGYGGGLERKRWLLQHEHALLEAARLKGEEPGGSARRKQAAQAGGEQLLPRQATLQFERQRDL
jgi:methylated-DNA-[protein]-cysteine S-methyltransferase